MDALKQDKASINDLRQKYGKVFAIGVELEDEDGNEIKKEFRFKNPKSTHYDRLLKEMSGKPSAAMKNYVFSLVIDEDRDELERTVEEYPGVAAGITDKLGEKIGLGTTVTIKKL